MGCPGVPASVQTFTQFYSYARMIQEVADVPRFHTVLRHDPKLSVDASVANWSTPSLPAFAADGFEKGIAWRYYAYCE